jgi:hypothetical protein
MTGGIMVWGLPTVALFYKPGINYPLSLVSLPELLTNDYRLIFKVKQEARRFSFGS